MERLLHLHYQQQGRIRVQATIPMLVCFNSWMCLTHHIEEDQMWSLHTSNGVNKRFLHQCPERSSHTLPCLRYKSLGLGTPGRPAFSSSHFKRSLSLSPPQTSLMKVTWHETISAWQLFEPNSGGAPAQITGPIIAAFKRHHMAAAGGVSGGGAGAPPASFQTSVWGATLPPFGGRFNREPPGRHRPGQPLWKDEDVPDEARSSVI